jgi:hypothetical protein
MALACLKDDNKLKGIRMCIVTGHRIDLAITLIDRMKRLFAEKGLMSFDTKGTILELNGVKIEAFHHAIWMLCSSPNLYPHQLL